MRNSICYLMSAVLMLLPSMTFAAESKIDLQRMQPIVETFNHLRSKTKLIQHYYGSKAIQEILLQYLEGLPEELPRVERNKNQYRMIIQNQLTTFEVVNSETGQFLINNRAFTFDGDKPIIENIERLRAMFEEKKEQKDKTTLSDLMLPRAEAFACLGLCIALASITIAGIVLIGPLAYQWFVSDLRKMKNLLQEAADLCGEKYMGMSTGQRTEFSTYRDNINQIAKDHTCVQNELVKSLQFLRQRSDLCDATDKLQACLKGPIKVTDPERFAKKIQEAQALHLEMSAKAAEANKAAAKKAKSSK